MLYQTKTKTKIMTTKTSELRIIASQVEIGSTYYTISHDKTYTHFHTILEINRTKSGRYTFKSSYNQYNNIKKTDFIQISTTNAVVGHKEVFDGKLDK